MGLLSKIGSVWRSWARPCGRSSGLEKHDVCIIDDCVRPARVSCFGMCQECFNNHTMRSISQSLSSLAGSIPQLIEKIGSQAMPDMTHLFNALSQSGQETPITASPAAGKKSKTSSPSADGGFFMPEIKAPKASIKNAASEVREVDSES